MQISDLDIFWGFFGGPFLMETFWFKSGGKYSVENFQWKLVGGKYLVDWGGRVDWDEGTT